MTDTADVPEISMANKKQEMLDAYNEMKTLLATQAQAVAEAEQERDRYKRQAAEVAAKLAEEGDPARRLHDMKAAIGRELASMAERYEEAVEEYTKLNRAVADKSDELERVYGVESAARDLAALLEAHRARNAAFEAETAAARAEWEAEKQARNAEASAAQQRLALEREREEEAHDYALARERERRRNELEDEMRALEREIAEKRDTTERELAALRSETEATVAARQSDVAAREQAVSDRELRLEELESKVQGFPEQMKTEIDRAVRDTTQRLQAMHEAEMALARKEHEGERNVLSSRIESLQQLIEQQAIQIKSLSTQQERAYAQVQEIASKAVEGAQRGSNTPPPQPRPQRMFEEGT